jgi:uncharacterized protein
MQATSFVGREAERAHLDDILQTKEANLIAMLGRRRVGKTFLIRNHLHKQKIFEFTGIHEVTTEQQLQEFSNALSKHLNKNIPLPLFDNWFTALRTLQKLLQPKLRSKKVVIFFDEFPWIQTAKSNFLAAFENFWNTWASLQPNLCVIICGSSASWMLKNVIHNRGGLHNRVTHKIMLQPFSLHEMQQFLQTKKITLNHYQLVQVYMAMGGIPHYLNNIKAGQSATQIISNACFTKSGFLYNEFTELFKSLFYNADKHIKVVQALAAKPMGLTREQLIKAAKLQTGGGTTEVLFGLSSSNFITAYIPVGKQTKDAIYKLTDCFCLFYLKFMDKNRQPSKGEWLRLSETAAWKSWSGLAFENICLLHADAIKNALGIQGMYSSNSIWRSKNGTAQVDLVIDRKDNCINLCEIKYYEAGFTIDKKYAEVLANKKQAFKTETKTRKYIFTTLIGTHNINHNIHSLGLVDTVITIDKLFAQKSL